MELIWVQICKVDARPRNEWARPRPRRAGSSQVLATALPGKIASWEFGPGTSTRGNLRHASEDCGVPEVLYRADRGRAEHVRLRLDRDGSVARRRRPGDVRGVFL